MIKKTLLLSLILCLYCIVCHNIYEKNISTSKKVLDSKTPSVINQQNATKEEVQENKIGSLKIEKLNLYEPLYEKDSIHNNVEENITILNNSIMPDKEDSIIFLAAHSGIGKIAYFKNLNKLEIGDTIQLDYNNTSYIYEVTNIWKESKDGYIHVSKNKVKQLILTTCSPTEDDKQLVVNCNLKA